jgi:hypothetical protein
VKCSLPSALESGIAMSCVSRFDSGCCQGDIIIFRRQLPLHLRSWTPSRVEGTDSHSRRLRSVVQNISPQLLHEIGILGGNMAQVGRRVDECEVIYLMQLMKMQCFDI